MPSWAIVENGTPTEHGGGPLIINGVQYVLDIFERALANDGWTVAELNALGVYLIVEPTIPYGQYIASSTLEWNGVDTVTRIATLADSPPPPWVTNLQFRQAVRDLGAGPTTTFRNYILGLDEDARENWNLAQRIYRNSAMVDAARVTLGRSEAEFDALFWAAALKSE